MENKELKLAVYQSSTSNKYYIKQEGQEEKEISKYEYDAIIEMKQRILDYHLKITDNDDKSQSVC